MKSKDVEEEITTLVIQGPMCHREYYVLGKGVEMGSAYQLAKRLK
jgi:hypothetical protein